MICREIYVIRKCLRTKIMIVRVLKHYHHSAHRIPKVSNLYIFQFLFCTRQFWITWVNLHIINKIYYVFFYALSTKLSLLLLCKARTVLIEKPIFYSRENIIFSCHSTRVKWQTNLSSLKKGCLTACRALILSSGSYTRSCNISSLQSWEPNGIIFARPEPVDAR